MMVLRSMKGMFVRTVVPGSLLWSAFGGNMAVVTALRITRRSTSDPQSPTLFDQNNNNSNHHSAIHAQRRTDEENSAADNDLDFGPLITGVEGRPSCPCLIDKAVPPVDPQDVTDDLRRVLGDQVNLTSYAVSGCGRHSLREYACRSEDCLWGPDYLPLPAQNQATCDRSWCQRAFCYVNPLNCTLTNRRSSYFPASRRFYSYATCGEMDVASNQYLISSLFGQTLRVAFVENSGGWTGSYNPFGTHFEGSLEDWEGPLPDFVKEATLRGGFQLKISRPPEELRQPAADYYGTGSSFSYCAYAASLGYVDMCIGEFTLTNLRVASAEWIPIRSEPQYLIVQTTMENPISVSTIFEPFTISSWLFMLCCVVPVLATLFHYHECVNVRRDKSESFYQYVMYWSESMYVFYKSMLEGGFTGHVLTTGGKITVLALNAFVLIFIAVYTANLAAILTRTAQVQSVASFEDAVRQGYRFCGARNRVAEVAGIYGVDDSVFVVDPPELGGDGKPGFNCNACSSRTRVFDFLDFRRASQGDPRYCHAAIGPAQDLEVLRARGFHCNKTIVGRPVALVNTGMPVHGPISRGAIAFFRILVNEGELDAALIANQPFDRCLRTADDKNVEEEGDSLTIAQLLGIWVVTFGLATLGVVVSVYQTHRPHAAVSKKSDENDVPVGIGRRHSSRLSRISFHHEPRTETEVSNLRLDLQNLEGLVREVLANQVSRAQSPEVLANHVSGDRSPLKDTNNILHGSGVTSLDESVKLEDENT